MRNVLHSLAFVSLLSLSAQAATYYECLVLVSTNGGYANLVTPDKATPPVDPYYYAQRDDLSSGPYPDRLLASDTNLFDYWFPFPTNSYPSMGTTNVSFLLSTPVGPQSGLKGVVLSYWTNSPIPSMYFDGVYQQEIIGVSTNGKGFHSEWYVGRVMYMNFWVRPLRVSQAAPNADWFVGWDYNAGSPYGGRYLMGYYTNTIRFYCRDTAANSLVVDADATGHASNWVMITAVIDATNMSLWTNAVLANSVPHNFTSNIWANPADVQELRIGSGYAGDGYYKGYVGEILGGTNDAFTNGTITNLWNAGVLKYGGEEK